MRLYIIANGVFRF